jgi:lipopolysaccharide biosynthesis glycosyltransferase
MSKLQLIKQILSATLVVIAVIASILIYHSNRKKLKFLLTDSYSFHHANERSDRIINEILNTLSTQEANDLFGIDNKISQVIIEESSSSVQKSNAYKKLAINNYKQGDVINLWKAILNMSAALDASYSSKNVELLAEMLNFKKDINILSKLGKQSELQLLKEAIAKADNDITKTLLSIRIAWILTHGKASADDRQHFPNMIEALKFKKQALNMLSLNLSMGNRHLVDILLVIDDGYAPHAAVTISSILLNALPETSYSFHILSDPEKPISDFWKSNITKLAEIHPAKFEFINFPNEIIEQQPIVIKSKIFSLDSHHQKNAKKESIPSWPKLIAYRLFIDKVFPDLDKILYLDADTIVNVDLAQLFNKNLDGYYLAAGADFMSFVKWANGLTKCSGERISFYFNSGVLLFNLKELRENNFISKVQELLHTTPCKLEFFDQDVLNIIAKDKTLRLANGWNFPDAVNYRHEFYLDGKITPFINHMYREITEEKVTKPWKQKNAQQLWKERKFEQIHPTFWPYWAYLDLVEDVINYKEMPN